MDSATGCPDDYAELFQNYFPMMCGVVAASGIEPDDVPDVAMDILARFIEKDGIGYYDPNRLHDVGESPDLPGARFRKAKFKGMLRGFTATYVMQYRDKQMIRHRRIPWRNETPVYTRGKGEVVTWIEENSEANDDVILDVEVSVSLVKALQQAREILVERSTAHRDYDRFIGLCISHGYLDGKIDNRRLREELGVCSRTVKFMMKEFKGVLEPLLAEAS